MSVASGVNRVEVSLRTQTQKAELFLIASNRTIRNICYVSMAVWSPDCPGVECVAQAGLKFLFQSDAVISGCCHHTRLICYPANLEASWNPLEA